MTHHLNNLGDSSPALAELRELLGGLKGYAELGLELAETRRLLAEVKAEAMWEQRRADDAEADVRFLKEQLKAEKVQRRMRYAPLDSQLVDACSDLEPRQIATLFAHALAPHSSLTAIEHTQWLVERFRDACLAVSEAAETEAEEVA